MLCVAVAFLFLISTKANAQTSHVIDTVRYDYYDLKGRPVQPGFFQEVTLGWSMWFLADDGFRRREVWISTIK